MEEITCSCIIKTTKALYLLIFCVSGRVCVRLGAGAELHLRGALVRHLLPAASEKHAGPRPPAHGRRLDSQRPDLRAGTVCVGHACALPHAHRAADRVQTHVVQPKPVHLPALSHHRALCGAFFAHGFLLPAHRQVSLGQHYSHRRTK